jgi:hypothetical protein
MAMDENTDNSIFNKNTGCLNPKSIAEYAAGKSLSKDTIKEIESHLEACDQCHKNYNDYLDGMFEYM